MSTAYVFTHDQLLNAGRAYVDGGPDATRAVRIAEVDGTLMFLQSETARKLRVVDKNPEAVAMPLGVRTSGYEGESRIAIPPATVTNAGGAVAGPQGVTARRDGTNSTKETP